MKECGETSRVRARAWMREFNRVEPEPEPSLPRARRPTVSRHWPQVSGRLGRDRYFFFGQVVSIHDLAAISGLRVQTIRRRLRRGLQIEDAVLLGCKL